MEAVGKHFPGHGSVEGDSHQVMPFDRRQLATIESHDLVPFQRVMNNHLAGVMMAHVIYDQVDPHPAGFSPFWIEQMLRQEMRFEGVVFSDDLNMAGAEIAGGFAQRAKAALDAGCDMLLVCNNPDGADEVLQSLSGYNNPVAQLRLVRMHGRRRDASNLFKTAAWKNAVKQLREFNQAAGLTASADLF